MTWPRNRRPRVSLSNTADGEAANEICVTCAARPGSHPGPDRPRLAKKDKPGTDWIPAEQVKQTLMKAGYSSITELEANDGDWEGEGLKNGVRMEFHVDPKTGTLTKEKPDKD